MRKDFEPHGLESRTEDGGTTEPLSARDGGEEDPEPWRQIPAEARHRVINFGPATPERVLDAQTVPCEVLQL